MNVEVTGAPIPHLSRREVMQFVRKAVIVLDRLGEIEEEISEISVAFVDDPAMKTLNRRFRRKNRTTDVLTFPADDSYADPQLKGRPLGDIVISVEQARRQAAGQRHSLPTEVRYLLLHGILHALGHDHESDSGEMNELEVRVREAVGLD